MDAAPVEAVEGSEAKDAEALEAGSMRDERTSRTALGDLESLMTRVILQAVSGLRVSVEREAYRMSRSRRTVLSSSSRALRAESWASQPSTAR